MWHSVQDGHRAMTSLQERRDAQTRAELSTVAIELFATQGYVETTMDDVATAAGVSRRTAYRHYPNKEDLIFEHPKQWLQVFRAATAERIPGETMQSLCERGVRAVAVRIEDTKDDVIPGYGVVAATPSLRSSYARMNRDWLDVYTELLSTEHDPDDIPAVMRSSIIAGALVGGTDRAVIHWFLHPGTSLIELTDHAIEAVAPLWM